MGLGLWRLADYERLGLKLVRLRLEAERLQLHIEWLGLKEERLGLKLEKLRLERLRLDLEKLGLAPMLAARWCQVEALLLELLLSFLQPPQPWI